MWRVVVAVGVLCGFSVAQKFDLCFPDTTQNVGSNDKFIFSGVDNFGFGLFRELNGLMSSEQSSDSSNLLISPYSVWSVLSLALMGTQGTARLQLEQALGLPDTKLGAYRTKYALDFVLQALGSGVGGGPELRGLDRAYFDSSVSVRDCVSNVIHDIQVLNITSDPTGSADKINKDVSIATGGEIKDLLSQDSLVNAVFVLLNAVYFKGTWQTKFDPQDTSKQVFYNSAGQQAATADMMTVQGPFNIVKSPALGATMLELPYDRSNMSMLILLPEIENPNVEGILTALSPYTLSQALQASQQLPVKVFLPKFDLKTKLGAQLVESLGKLGITDVFDRSRADFSSFSSDASQLYIDTAVHQAKVKVDEVGTVAAAATALIGTRSGPGNTIQFVANRPFVFLIYEKRVKVTLFAGVIRNPTA
ncbi:Serpin domain [Trinorchestia longiramus]|nr:Serpin domain [Trinorchestia longiramus]